MNFSIKKLKEKLHEEFGPEICVLQKYRPLFVTTDGEEHCGITYKYINSSRLIVSVPEYIMINIKNDGYIKDNNRVMYPLPNVVSIRWELIEEKVKQYYKGEYEYQIFFTAEEVENMEDYLLGE